MSQLEDIIKHSNSLGARTRELYTECVASFVAFAGDKPETYTPGLVEEWLFGLRRGRLPQTVNVYRKAIRYASRQWAKRGTRSAPRDDFAANVEAIKVKKGTPREPLTLDEAKALLATCATATPVDVRDRALLTLALRTGLRRGGICAMQIEDVKPPKITTINKGGDSITFVADEETLNALHAWLVYLREQGTNRGAVFRNLDETWRPMTPFQIWHVFRVRARRAGVRDGHVFPHLARHTTVTWLREAGKSAAEVSQLTGQTERTIEDIYTHVRPREAVAAALPTLTPKK